MTPSCPSRAEWVRHQDGEVTANRAAELASHAASCSACRSEVTALADIVGALQPRAGRADLAFTELVMSRIGTSAISATDKPRAKRPLWQRWPWLAGGFAVAATAAASR